MSFMIKSVTILIPHNRLPHLHDAFTLQSKKICSDLSKKINLKIVWIIFPSIPPFKKLDAKLTDEKIIFPDQFNNVAEIFEYVNPDLVIINGTLDFHNVQTFLMSNFLSIPTVSLFFRNAHLIKFSLISTIKTRFRIFFDKNNQETSDITSDITSPSVFFMSQLKSVFKTLKKAGFKRFQSIIFILHYMFIILFNSYPTHKIISGNINFCINERMKNKLISADFDPSTVFVTGDPFFDDLKLTTINNQCEKKLDKIKILFCPTPRHEHGLTSKKKEFHLIINVINKILNENDLEVALKLHPSSSIMEEYANELDGKIKKSITFYQSENLLKLLSKYDVLLTYGGTNAITSAILNQKPVINLNFKTDLTGEVVFYDDNLITQCRDINFLVSDIKKTKSIHISEIDIKKFLQNYFGYVDGTSSAFASDIIINLLKNRLNNK
jgi:hypothetical protein